MVNNITGMNFGGVTAIRLLKSVNNRRIWLLRCDCGVEFERAATDIIYAAKKNREQSCGCKLSKIRSKNGKLQRTHGLTTQPVTRKLYDVWRQMHRRCEDTKCKDYNMYGGRGIHVCDEWHDCKSFVAWAFSSGYSEGLTIERVDNNKNYSPDNCSWILNECQALNTRRLRFITVGSVTAPVSEWARKNNIGSRTIISRLNRGWSDERSVTP